ncbi:MAG: outer membrane beta-barrel protein [Gammaproteobacteria bacterium]|nr:outer membrane beta-barrel protein [Gammaproteobacteria bacterium]
MFRRVITILACLSAPAGLAAQGPVNGEYGRIVGHVFSTQTGDALPGVQVFIAGTAIGTLTSPDGRFVLRNVPVGTHSVQTEMIGYGSKIVSDVMVTNGGDPVVLDITIDPQAIELQGLTVSVEAERGNTAALLGERRRAAVVVDAIGQDQISRSPDGDAGAVLKRVPGVSLVDGKYAFVRGLGERYSATTLNGTRLASPVPDKKVIPLDVIPSGMLESIVTAKTYSPDQPGDYSGGLVQMRTRDFPTSRIFSISASSGWNSVTTFKDGLGYAGGSLDFLGLDDGTRDLPSAIPTDAAVRYSRNGLSRNDLATIGQSFGGDWGPTPVTLSPDQSFSASFGDELDLFSRSFGFLASVSQSRSYSQQADLVERVFATGGGADEPEVDYAGDFTTASASIGGLMNLSYELAPAHTIRANLVYNRLADDESRSLEGYNLDSGTDQWNTRIRYVSQTLTNAQLEGTHVLQGLGGSSFKWRSTYTRAERYEPNTREVLYRASGGTFIYDDFIQSGSVFHQDMVDDGLSGGADMEVPFQLRALPASIRFGVSSDRRQRDNFSRRFRFRPRRGGDINSSVLALPPNELLAPQYMSPTGFEIQEATFRADNYDAEETVDAGYLMMDAEILPRVRLVGGARVERTRQVVAPVDLFPVPGLEPLVGADVNKTQWLPALNLTWEVSAATNIRASVSQTLARPQLRELAPFAFADYAGGYLVVGNPELTVSRIRNFDLRWERFFGPGSLIAVSGFYKQFRNPIEALTFPSTELIRSWVNAPDANNYGTEIELRTGLAFLSESLENFSLNTNLTLVNSTVATGGTARIYLQGSGPTDLAVVDRERGLQGQSPYMVNFSLAYASRSEDTRASVFYNRFGRRIDAIGGQATPDIYEEGRGTMDAVLEQRLPGDFSIKLSLTRLRGNVVRFTQGDGTVRQYDGGRRVSLSMRWGS